MSPGGPCLKSVEAADLAACDGAGSFLQSGFWGSFKARFGWDAFAFSVDWIEWGTMPLLVLRRKPGPFFSFAYVPWGPELPAAEAAVQSSALADLAKALKRLLPKDTAFIRFDLPWYGEGLRAPLSPGASFSKGTNVQVPDTVLVDLSPPAVAILENMKNKCRYNIGLAERKGVKISRPDEQGLEVFYRLLGETARRDGIAVHGIEYYRGLFESARDYCPSAGTPGLQIRLYLASHNGDALASVVVLVRGKDAVYLYGASSNGKRNLMAPHALQWRAMLDAKECGCAQYDLFGIPPNEDPAHPMAGLYRFKTGFGGRIIHRPGCWDYAYRSLMNRAFKAAERFRKTLRDKKKKRKR